MVRRMSYEGLLRALAGLGQVLARPRAAVVSHLGLRVYPEGPPHLASRLVLVSKTAAQSPADQVS